MGIFDIVYTRKLLS